MTEKEFDELLILVGGLGAISESKRTRKRVEDMLNILYREKELIIHSVVLRSEQLADQKRYCNDCGDYVGDGCDNKGCKDFKAN